MNVRFVLHRPRNSQNIGAAARALANTSAGELWVVEPVGFDRVQAARLAAGADAILDNMQVRGDLDEALADCVDVVMTTSRAGPDVLTPRETAARLLQATGPVALVFGDEVRGLSNLQLARAGAVATIPTTEKKSINLAQAVLIFAYETMLARGNAKPIPTKVAEPPPEDRLLKLLRDQSQALLLSAGFLNPQRPDAVLDELLQLLRRARPSRREVELLLGACTQLQRSVGKK